MVELTIIEGGGGDSPQAPTGAPVPTTAMIEDAMTEAVTQCSREGITDPDVILQRKLAARARVMGVS